MTIGDELPDLSEEREPIETLERYDTDDPDETREPDEDESEPPNHVLGVNILRRKPHSAMTIA